MFAIVKIFIILLIFNGFTWPCLGESRILLDYREDNLWDTSEDSKKLSPAIEKAVIQSVITKDDRACFGTLTPRVIDHALGSFTNIRLQQVVYLVDLGDSCHPRATGTVRLAIATGNRIITYGDVTGYRSIKKITDIDNDGINGIILQGGWMGTGHLTVSARLLTIKPRGILTLKTFNRVFESWCIMDIRNCYRRASVVLVHIDRKGLPVFTRKNYIAKCDGDYFSSETICGSYTIDKAFNPEID